MITDKELIDWLESNQDWITLKCQYFARSIEDGKELKAAAQENMWKYRKNFNREPTSDNIKSWAFFAIKYAYFHILEQKYKMPTYHYDKYNSPELITESSVLRQLQAEMDISKVSALIEQKLSKTHLKMQILTVEGYSRAEISDKLDIKISLIDKYRRDVSDLILGKDTQKKEIKRYTKTKQRELAYES